LRCLDLSIRPPGTLEIIGDSAAVLLMTEQNFRKIIGYRDLWMLKAALDQKGVLAQQEVA